MIGIHDKSNHFEDEAAVLKEILLYPHLEVVDITGKKPNTHETRDWIRNPSNHKLTGESVRKMKVDKNNKLK